MDQTISVTEASRHFSRLLRSVQNGQSYVVTNQGRPVARLVAIGKPDCSAPDARAALVSRLEGQRVIEGGLFTRDALYE